MSEEVKLVWDGETVKQSVNIPDKKLTPKEILDSLDHVRNQILQLKQQKQQIEQQSVTIDRNLKSGESFEKERGEFEEECLRIQKEKLKLYINQLTLEYKEQAIKDAEKTIAEDPNAYTEDQKQNMKYVNFQKLLGTNGKIAQNISKRIITECLYQKPIFDNPYKKD